MFLLGLPLISAKSTVLYNWTVSTNASESNFTLTDCTINQSGNYLLKCPNTGTAVADYINKLPNLSTNTNSWTIEFYRLSLNTDTSADRQIVFAPFNMSGTPHSLSSGKNTVWIRGANEGQDIYFWDRSETQVFPNIRFATSDELNLTLKLSFLMNNSINYTINGTINGNIPLVSGSLGTTENVSFMRITSDLNSNSQVYDFAVYNGTTTDDGITDIINISPSISINTPLNNSQSHNATMNLNFTISTTSPNFNFTFEVYADKNSTYTTRLNRSENFTSGNFTIIYSFPEYLGSVNGTIFIKINGTDNASNNFEVFHTYNITNDLNLYNTTNVSITPLPIEVNTQIKGHFNLTNKANILTSAPNQSDNITISDCNWYLNRTLVTTAGNNSFLNAPNITNNANVTRSCRVNNGFGSTAWTQYVNSSTTIVGDTTNPFLNNCTLSSTSITDASGSTINLTCEATDVSNIQTMVATLNGTINKTLTFSFTQATTIKPTYVIFQSLETLLVGSYSVSQVNVTDTSSNKLSNATNDLHFSVTSAPSPSPSPAPAGGGGGGGGTQTAKSENTTFNLLTENFGEEYGSINVNSNSVKEIKILIENLGNKTTIINLKCIESTRLTTTILLCNNVQFSQESLNLVPSTFPLETLIKVRIPEAELFKTFSLIIQGTSTEGGEDNLRMSFIIFPRATDFFRLLKQLAMGITRFHIGDSSIPFPNIVSFLFLEGIILVIFIRRQFAGKWIVLTLLSLVVLIITTALSFEICKLSFAECLSL